MDYKPHHTCKTLAHHLFDEIMEPYRTFIPRGSGMGHKKLAKVFMRHDKDGLLLNMLEKDGNVLHQDSINSLRRVIK